MNNLSLFLVSSIIWGSTWLMITFQLGEVSPMISVVYRFSLASLILFCFCLVNKRKFNFGRSDHFLVLMQGLLLFGFNYWLTYIAISEINSALAAILSTSIIYFNVVFARLFLGDKIRNEVLFGATIGVIGVILIFMPELRLNSNTQKTWEGIVLILTGSILASLGNILSAKTQRRKISVIQANALGMGYASIFLAVIALISGYQFNFEFSFGYIGSLVYLALFGSVIAFGAFLTLVGRIGPDKAAYVTFVFPVVAMIMSTIFEDYQWKKEGVLGLVVILFGNFVAMGKYRSLPFYPRLRDRLSKDS